MADIGIFSERVFHPDIYDTGGEGKSKYNLPDRQFFKYKQALEEDEDILALIMSAVTSGMLEH